MRSPTGSTASRRMCVSATPHRNASSNARASVAKASSAATSAAARPRSTTRRCSRVSQMTDTTAAGEAALPHGSPTLGGAPTNRQPNDASAEGASPERERSGARDKQRKALSIYLMCGPDTPALAAAAVDGGADLLELGFPFSDPLADGPVVRRAGERALAQGMRTAACLQVVREARALIDVPLIPMPYASIPEACGWARFAADARA